MSDTRKKLGAAGETLAAKHLEANGYTIVSRNWRCRIGEIDIIAQRGDHMAFVEVKTRRGGTPETAITYRKAQKLLNLAAAWLAETERDDLELSIDVIAVAMDKSGKLLRITHHEGAVSSW